MKYRIIFSRQADTDLRNINEYITFTLLEPSIAVRQLGRIEKAILSLDEIPERFRMVEKSLDIAGDLGKCQ